MRNREKYYWTEYKGKVMVAIRYEDTFFFDGMFVNKSDLDKEQRFVEIDLPSIGYFDFRAIPAGQLFRSKGVDANDDSA